MENAHVEDVQNLVLYTWSSLKWTADVFILNECVNVGF